MISCELFFVNDFSANLKKSALRFPLSTYQKFLLLAKFSM